MIQAAKSIYGIYGVKTIIILTLILLPLYIAITQGVLNTQGVNKYMSPKSIFYSFLLMGIGLVSIGLKKVAGGDSTNLFLQYVALFSGLILLTWLAVKWNNNLLFALIVLYFIVNYAHLDKIVKFKRINTFNKIVFWVSILYIVHILWVILTFTSPTIQPTIDLPPEKTCSAPWLYYGNYPPSQLNKTNQYHDYLFDITTWFPPDIEDNPSYKCQPCPINKTPLKSHSGTNLSCRPCKSDEEWYSINDLDTKFTNNTLTGDQKKEIGNGGRTLRVQELGADNIGSKSLKTYQTNYGDKFDEMNKNNGMCLSIKSSVSSFTPYTGGTNCINYKSCMEKAPAYIDLSWPINKPVYPEQLFELKHLDTPVSFRIPKNIYTDDCSNKDTKYNNKYHNPVCNKKGKRCHLKIPIDPTPYLSTKMPPKGFRIERHGGASSGEGPPCNIVNQLSQDYNLIGTKIPDPSNDILTNQIVDEGTYTDSNTGKQTAKDWKNIVGMVYEECYDHKGQCHIKDYVCETKGKKTPIPLVDYTVKPTPVLIIPEYNNTGCQNATKIDTCLSKPKDPCTAMGIDDNGFLIDVLGKCKYSKWENKKWNTMDTNTNKSTTGYHLRCFPNKFKAGSNVLNGKTNFNPVTYPIKKGEKLHKLKQSICQRIPKMTDPDIEAQIIKRNPCLKKDKDTKPVSGSSSSSSSSSSQSSKHTGSGRRSCKYNPPKGINCILNNDPYAYYYEDNEYEDRCCIIANKNSPVNVKIQKDWTTKTPGNKKITYTVKNSPFTKKIEESSKP